MVSVNVAQWDEYSKASNKLVIKVPQMTLEEKLYVFIKGLKHNVQVSVSLHSPTTVEQAKLLAATADVILSSQRYYGGGSSSGFSKATPMEIGKVGLRKNRLKPTEYERRRSAGLCFVGGKDLADRRNQPDDASNHREVDGDVGSQILWDEALEEAV
jgi:hypothetical protein